MKDQLGRSRVAGVCSVGKQAEYAVGLVRLGFGVLRGMANPLEESREEHSEADDEEEGAPQRVPRHGKYGRFAHGPGGSSAPRIVMRIDSR